MKEGQCKAEYAVHWRQLRAARKAGQGRRPWQKAWTWQYLYHVRGEQATTKPLCTLGLP